jgi:hypothetical protein
MFARTTATIRMSEELIRQTKELLVQSRLLRETNDGITIETELRCEAMAEFRQRRALPRVVYRP